MINRIKYLRAAYEFWTDFYFGPTYIDVFINESYIESTKKNSNSFLE